MKKGVDGFGEVEGSLGGFSAVAVSGGLKGGRRNREREGRNWVFRRVREERTKMVRRWGKVSAECVEGGRSSSFCLID